MEQLLSWGWDGVVLVTVGLLVLRAIPVAFDAWKSGNLIVGTVKTVGPIVTLAALLYGGWWVMRDAASFIYHDAQRVDLITDARQWTDSGATAIGNGASDLGSGLSGYVESFRSEWNTGATTNTQAAPETQASAPAAANTDPLATAQPAALAAPTATPDTSVWSAAGINGLWNSGNTTMGPAPAPTYGPAPKPADSGQTFFPVGGDGGGPAAADADNALATVTEARTYTVERGDDLTKIAVAVYGNRREWVAICNANRKIVRDCNTLRVGMVLTIPVLNHK